MRVLIPMLYYYPDHPSGSVRLAFDEAVYLAGQGHEVWVITQDPTGAQPEYTLRDGLHVLQYASPKVGTFSPRRARIHQDLVYDLLRRHLREPVDLVHGHALLQYDGALRLYRKRARCAYSVHSPTKLEVQVSSRGQSLMKRIKNNITAHLSHQIEARCLAQSDIVTSDSVYTQTILGELHTPDIAARVRVVPGWVDTQRFQIAQDRQALKQQLGWPTDTPTLFTLRRLVPRNGLDQLLYALEIVMKAGHSFKLFIGGSGPLRAELEQLAAQLGLTEYVCFLGFVPDDDLPHLYAAADLFVLPTSALECFGLITLEAWATGRPVLATPVAAIPEIMTQIEPAWLTRDASPQAIAEGIVRYLAGELPKHPPEALREFVVANYSSERVIPQLVETVLNA